MKGYHEARKRHAERVFKEYSEAYALLVEYLKKQKAPEGIQEALRKVANRPTIWWA